MKDFRSTKMLKPKKFKNLYNKVQREHKKAEKNNNVSLWNTMQPFIFLKKYEFDLQLGLIVIVIFVIFLTVHNLNQQYENTIKEHELYRLDYRVKLSTYPLMNSYTIPDISASAAIITDADSQIVLHAKNPNLRFSMASTAKIMTAVVALDYFQENSVLTIYTPKIEGSNLGFQQGEKYYFKDLLFAMFLPSSNEAAYAISQNYPGGSEAFVTKMNEKARELNLSNTYFKDPAGLDDDSNYSTVSDMSRLASLIVKNKLLADITATKQKDIYDVTGKRQIQLTNLNKLLGIDGVNGIKTGTTEGAGQVLVTSKVENGHTFIVVVMKSKQRFTDTRALLTLISKNIRYITPQYPVKTRTNISNYF